MYLFVTTVTFGMCVGVWPQKFLFDVIAWITEARCLLSASCLILLWL